MAAEEFQIMQVSASSWARIVKYGQRWKPKKWEYNPLNLFSDCNQIIQHVM